MSAFDPVNPVMIQAFAVALSARTRTLDAMEVDDLQAHAAQVLDRDDPLFRAVNTFATMFDLHRRDPVEVEALGCTLQSAIETLSRPDPIDIGRRDIHG